MNKEEQFKRELEELMQEFVKKIQEKVLEGEEPKAVKITMDDVEFDDQGRVIIRNPEIAERLKKWMEESEEVYLGHLGNIFCSEINLGC
ncbi:MAG: hypothetical protein GXO48_04180 [Chlorobi bacterium]|nr:hypothetical protein [Chlorobiota bacterium]